MIKYYKECPKSEATHYLSEKPHLNMKELMIVDLSQLYCNKEILFEFSDNGESWVEGYLLEADLRMRDPFYCAVLRDGRLHTREVYKYIRFQSNRWYPWLGGKCPLPEGVSAEVRLSNGTLSTLRWSHSADIIAFRIIGPSKGWKLPVSNSV